MLTAWRQYGFVTALCAFTSGTIAAIGILVWRWDATLWSDSNAYIAMVRGGHGGVEKPFRYRVLVPWLVAHIAPPASPGGELWPVALRFGLVAAVSLTVAGVALYLLLRDWGASTMLALVGVCLWYMAHPVMLFAGVPLIEAAAFAALILAMLAAERRRWIIFGLIVLVGMTIKETTVLALVYPLLLTGRTWFERLRLIAVGIPGVAAYAIYRLVIDPVDYGYSYSWTAWIHNIGALFTTPIDPSHLMFHPWANILFGLGVVWIPLAVALHHHDGLIPNRYGWFVALAIAMPFLLSTDNERVIFLAAPVALGLALPTIARWMGTDAPPSEISTGGASMAISRT